jgi:hypothetical protein
MKKPLPDFDDVRVGMRLINQPGHVAIVTRIENGFICYEWPTIEDLYARVDRQNWLFIKKHLWLLSNGLEEARRRALESE